LHDQSFSVDLLPISEDLQKIELATDSALDSIYFSGDTRSRYYLVRENTNLLLLAAAPLGQVLSRPLVDLSDFLVVADRVFVIYGRELAYIGDDGGLVSVTELPVDGMRFGQIWLSTGQAYQIPHEIPMSFLVFGGSGPSYVYRIMSNGSHVKLVESENQIVAATGCESEVYFASDGTVYLGKRGYEPFVVSKIPADNSAKDEILSLSAVSGQTYFANGGKYVANCRVYASTRSAVFAMEGGLTTIAVAGVGGYLRGELLFEPSTKRVFRVKKRP
jgi:hypothetical protein